MKILRRSLSIVLLGLVLLPLVSAPVVAQEIPQLPARYWGTVKIYNGTQEIDAPIGTVITVWVDGVERGRIVTTEPGKYGGPTALDRKLSVQGEIAQGSLVEFYINGVKAGQTASFQNDHPEEINLTVSAMRGDANADAKVNAVDITKVERIIVLLDAPTLGADANQDGTINALDVTKVEMLIAGLG